jgi:hypothetical protein
MCVNLYNEYTECGRTTKTGHDPCLNITDCGPRRGRTERVEELCQRCTENFKKMYRMNGLDFNIRGNGLVLGQPTFDNERRRLEKHAEGKKSGEAEESEGQGGDEVAI